MASIAFVNKVISSLQKKKNKTPLKLIKILYNVSRSHFIEYFVGFYSNIYLRQWRIKIRKFHKNSQFPFPLFSINMEFIE